MLCGKNDFFADAMHGSNGQATRLLLVETWSQAPTATTEWRPQLKKKVVSHGTTRCPDKIA